MFNLSNPLAHLETYLIVDGTKYQIEKFEISYSQDSDYKGQPQQEVRGGLMRITLPQTADNILFLWARKSTLVKDGQVLFESDLGKRVLTINFKGAYCINLTRDINALTGTKTSLTISPEATTIDDIPHENFWKKS
jgi:hypothetical protein